MNRGDLLQKQLLPLSSKIEMSKRRIREFYNEMDGGVYVAFSGGKDSTVLLHLVRSIYPDIPAVFVDTGLEYPEIREFVKKTKSVTWLKPKMNFRQVIDKYGFPIVSKRVAYQLRQLRNPRESNKATRRFYLTGIKKDGSYSSKFLLPKKWKYLIDAPFKISEQCCYEMKKKPFKEYNKINNSKPYIGIMAEDSSNRRALYLKRGCNVIDGANIHSWPLSFWLQKDIWDYIKKYNLDYSSIYDKGVDNTGCIFCMFEVHLESEPNRFQCLKRTHPKLWDYCINKLGLKEVLEYIGVDYENENV